MLPEQTPAALSSDALRPRLRLIIESFARLTGRPLVSYTGEPAQALWTASRAIVAHGSEVDPVFFFGNRAALCRFEMTPEQFIAMPSRLSAEPLLREERLRLLDRVTRQGFIDDYSGVRISATGKRFRIEQAAVWNLIDERGGIHGQAATFDRTIDLN